MIPRIVARAALCAVLSATASAAQDRTMPPESERQLARAIYKEMIEIKTGYTTGATTPLAEAVARRLKAAGFPAADIFVGGASPTKIMMPSPPGLEATSMSKSGFQLLMDQILPA